MFALCPIPSAIVPDYALKFGEIYLNRSNGEAVQGFHTGWGHSGLGGEDGQHGFDAYLRKQTTYLNWG